MSKGSRLFGTGTISVLSVLKPVIMCRKKNDNAGDDENGKVKPIFLLSTVAAEYYWSCFEAHKQTLFTAIRSGRKTHQGINRTWNGPTLDGELSTASAFSLWPVIMVHRWFHFTLLCLSFSFSSSSFVILKLFLVVLGMRQNKVSLSLSLRSTTMLFGVEVLLVFH